jgi:hypothetical protein
MLLLSNGFPISPDASELGVRSYTVPGTSVHLSVRSDIAPLLIGFAAEFNRLIEPLHAGQCFGYNYRTIKGSTTWSNHAGGVAIDLNSLLHPWGAVGTFPDATVPVIRSLAARYGLRWGGDYRGKKDEMHFEVLLVFGQALALAQRLPAAGAASTQVFPKIPQDVAVLDLSMVGQRRTDQILEAVTKTALIRTIEGASSVVLTVLDPTRSLLRGIAAEDPGAELTVDGDSYGLAAVNKRGDSLELTFEDMAAVALRGRKGLRIVAAHTMSRTDFIRSLAQEAGLTFIGQTSQLVDALDARSDQAFSKEPLSRGTEEDPDTESSWDASARIAAEVTWRRFTVSRTVYVGSDAWLRDSQPITEVSENTPGVDNIDFRFDIGLPVDEATISCNFTRTQFRIGAPIQVLQCGPADGLWIVKDTKRPFESPQGVVTLQRIVKDRAPTSNATPDPIFPGPATGIIGQFTGSDSGDKNGNLTALEVAQVLYDAGFGVGDELAQTIYAVAIAKAESGWNVRKTSPKNRNGSYDYGLMQINSIHGDYNRTQLITSARYNAQAAFAIYKAAGRKFTPWVTWKNGRYQAYVSEAAAAVQQLIPKPSK